MDFDNIQRNILKLIALCLLIVPAVQAAEQDKQLFVQANQLLTQGLYLPAEKIYRDLMQRHDDWPEPKNNLAILLLKTQRQNEARQMLESAVSSSPGFKIAQQNRTHLYNHIAAQAYDKAVGSAKKLPGPALRMIDDIHQTVQVVEKTVEVIVEKPVIKYIEKEPVVVEQPVQPVTDSPSLVHSSQLSNNIKQRLLGWSRAWSQGDYGHYIRTYSDDFVPSDSRKTFNEWKNIRRARLRYSKSVNVSLDELRVFLEPDKNFALVEFVQNYQSSKYSDKVLKQMYMQRQNNDWFILSERTIKTY